MTSGLVIGYSMYIAFAFALALALAFGFAIALDAGGRIRNEPVPLALIAIILAIMSAPLATGRVLSAGLSTADATLEEIGSSFWLARLATILVLALCAERIVRYFLRKRIALSGWPLLATFFAFAFCSQLLNGAFGLKPAFDHKWFYAFIIYFAFFIVAQQQPDRCFRIARWALFIFLAGSAVAVGVRPAAVLEFGYAGGLPGFSIRYYGLATHANTMGPLAIAMLIVLWRYPFSHRWFNLFAWGLAGASLLLSQSKTSIGIGAGLWCFLAIHRFRARLVRAKPDKAIQFSLGLWVVSCLALAGIVAGALAGVNYFDWVVGKLDTVTGGQWASLSGRTRIWALAWNEFLAHPIFGYGPTIWDPEYRFFAQMPHANHAHNQLLQSLSSGGAVAGLALLAYATTLTVFALRASERTGGVSVALVALMLIRSVSEVPFSTGGIIQSEFIVHLLAMIACLVPAGSPAKEALAVSTIKTSLGGGRLAASKEVPA